MVRRELLTFLIVGILTVCVDYAIYRLMYAALPHQPTLTKGIGFIGGTLFAYFANRLLTFRSAAPMRGAIVRFAALYACTLGVNVLLNRLTLFWLQGWHDAVVLAFLAATGT